MIKKPPRDRRRRKYPPKDAFAADIAKRCERCHAVMSRWAKGKRFCSRACANKFRVRDYICVICRQAWEPINRKVYSKRQTCSEKCHKVLRSIASQRRWSKRHTATEACPICGVTFRAYSKDMHKRTACSRKCAAALSHRNPNRKPRWGRPPKVPTCTT